MFKRSFMLFVSVTALLYVFMSGVAVSAISRNGSTGDEVRQIQTKLKNWG